MTKFDARRSRSIKLHQSIIRAIGSILVDSSFYRNLDDIKQLIREGVDINFPNPMLETPLQLVGERKKEIIDKLNELEALLKEAGAIDKVDPADLLKDLRK